MPTNDELLELHTLGLAEFGERVMLVGADDWQASTPDTEWTVRDLLTHLVDEQLWVPGLLAGKTMDEIGSPYDDDPLGAEPVRAWHEASERAHAAFGEPGALERTVHLSYGDSDAARYCWEMTTDLAIHAWDLARALGVDEQIDAGLLGEVHRRTEPHAEQLAASGLFAPPVQVPEDADLLTRTLALFGRSR